MNKLISTLFCTHPVANIFPLKLSSCYTKAKRSAYNKRVECIIPENGVFSCVPAILQNQKWDPGHFLANATIRRII